LARKNIYLHELCVQNERLNFSVIRSSISM